MRKRKFRVGSLMKDSLPSTTHMDAWVTQKLIVRLKRKETVAPKMINQYGD
ncbi:hypothetical protein PTKIN_Ptkin10aG0042100 [Pterospermum kingtungense]